MRARRARVSIRRVEPSDAQLIRAIRLRSLEVDPLSFGSTYAREAAFDDGSWDEWATEDAQGEEMATLLALDGRQPVGIVGTYRDSTDSQLFHVIAMWVAPETRRRGVSRRLLAEIEAWVAAAGGTTVQLFVTDAAAAARALYTSSGYTPDGERTESRHSAGLTEISLRKTLSPPEDERSTRADDRSIEP